jgi:hypothetical protein
MNYYRIETATGDRYIQADGYFMGGNYELPIEGQQPYICFYRGSRHHHVGMFMLKNIAGWMEIDETDYRNALRAITPSR